MKKRMATVFLIAAMLLSVLPAVAWGANINRLTGVDAVAYGYLEDYVAQVARGERSSTVFEVPVSALGLERQYWDAEALGVSPLVESGAITAAASNAMYSKIRPDLGAVVGTLLLAHPYELYWFDKTTDYTYSLPLLHGRGVGGEWELYFSDDAVLTFSLAVAEEYAADEAHTVDTGKATAAWMTTATAEELVARYAAASDYEKLVAYRQAICAMVAYNHAAADNSATPYGNPWQPVWVFDGDDGTDVVCEGYAKAFQHLCDLTAFRGDVRCYTVSGYMYGATGAGAHMWNIVTMPDGANYLVDVTNCDAGTVGADDLLFLKGYASGDADSYYVYRCGRQNIAYQYGSTMRDFYTAEELTLSAEDYAVSAPTFAGAAMTLDSGISLQFVVDPGDVGGGAYVDFAWGESKTAVDDSAETVAAGDYAGYDRYACPITARELSATVTAVLRDAEGKALDTCRLSAADYLGTLTKENGYTAAAVTLAQAVLTYGAAAEAHFLTGETVKVAEITDAIPTFYDAAAAVTESDGVSYFGKSLLTKDVTLLRLYFAAETAPAVTVDGASVTAEAADAAGYYLVDIPVAAADLGRGFTVALDGTALQFTVGVNDYIARTLASHSDDTLAQLCKALYHYGAAAAAYENG